MRTALIVFLLLVPDRPIPPSQLDISGPSHWGVIVQEGKKISIKGDDYWEAVGELDGKTLKVTWYRLEDGRIGSGTYNIDEYNNIIGHWDWIGDNFETYDCLRGEDE